jgi:D-alanyl-D-alanine dipeptidase
MARTARFTPKAETQEAMELIAHITIASDFDRNIEGMKGSLDCFLKKLTPRQRAMWEHFQKTAKRVREDLMAMMKADGWDKGES